MENAGDSRQVSRHTSEVGWMVKRANNEAVSWVGGRRGCEWTIRGPARGTWFKCRLTSRDKELIELERES